MQYFWGIFLLRSFYDLIIAKCELKTIQTFEMTSSLQLKQVKFADDCIDIK